MKELKPLIAKEGKHSEFSFSASERWLNCPGSIKAAAGAPVGKSSSYAQEGRAAHRLAEDCLRKGERAKDRIGQLIIVKAHDMESTFTVDPDMAEHIDSYLARLEKIAPKKDLVTGAKKVFIEHKVSLGFITPKAYGTADFICYDRPARHLTIVDLKYGSGLQVSPYMNPQLMLYALSTIYELEIWEEVKKVTVEIFQPRGGGESSKFWTVSPKDLFAWCRMIVWPGVKAAGEKEPVLKAGKWCRWCPKKPQCQVWHKWQEELRGEAGFPFNPLDFGPDQLARALDLADDLNDWIAAAKAAALERMVSGHPIPGWELSSTSTHRRWAVEEPEILSLAEEAGLEPFTKKLVSPAQFEKALKKKKKMKLLEKFEMMVEKPPGNPRISRAEKRDPRDFPPLPKKQKKDAGAVPDDFFPF
jgi:hypothetical protein